MKACQKERLTTPLFDTPTEWKGRKDGLVAHVFFHRDKNFALSVFAFAVEGWIFYSAINSITPQLVLNLGFEDNAWHISLRQLSFSLTNLLFSVVVTWYSTRFKDLKSPLLVSWVFFLVAYIFRSLGLLGTPLS